MVVFKGEETRRFELLVAKIYKGRPRLRQILTGKTPLIAQVQSTLIKLRLTSSGFESREFVLTKVI